MKSGREFSVVFVVVLLLLSAEKCCENQSGMKKEANILRLLSPVGPRKSNSRLFFSAVL